MTQSFNDLVALMAKLRSPQGCPWDREQTYETLAPMLLEEAYDVFDAVIDAPREEPAGLLEELGDLLFQIVFYAQIAAEQGSFTIHDVVAAVHTKMVRRHPHVFNGASAQNSAEVLQNWEAIKAEEKKLKTGANQNAKQQESLLDGVSTNLPSLMEAHQITAKAARVGFDWQRIEDVFAKTEEETGELRAAIDNRPSEGGDNLSQVREEVGDLLFAVSNIARHLSVDPESALKLANRKFRHRFHHVERGLRQRDQSLEKASLDEMESLWEEAKKKEKAAEFNQ